MRVIRLTVVGHLWLARLFLRCWPVCRQFLFVCVADVQTSLTSRKYFRKHEIEDSIGVFSWPFVLHEHPSSKAFTCRLASKLENGREFCQGFVQLQ